MTRRLLIWPFLLWLAGCLLRPAPSAPFLSPEVYPVTPGVAAPRLTDSASPGTMASPVVLASPVVPSLIPGVTVSAGTVLPVSPVAPSLSGVVFSDGTTVPSVVSSLTPPKLSLSLSPAFPVTSCSPQTAFCLYPHRPLLQFPLAAEALSPPVSGYTYGQTQNGLRNPHHGIDFPASYGSPVLAAFAGRVIFAGEDRLPQFAPWSKFYGRLILLEHVHPESGVHFYTLYGHLSALHVQEGQEVRQGEIIGEVGMSGVAIGSHLHFEVRLSGHAYDDTRNPELWLPLLDAKNGLLVGRVENAQKRPLHFTLNLQAYPPEGNLPLWSQALETYSLEERFPVGRDDMFQENFLRGELPPGRYRLSLVRGGRVIERFFLIRSGHLTYLILTVP